jgi:hypothetical protein
VCHDSGKEHGIYVTRPRVTRQCQS